MNERDVDIFGMVETNVNFFKAKKKDTLWERTRGWFEGSHLLVAFNAMDTLSNTLQYGGVLNMTSNMMSHRVIDQGNDLRQWERLIWTKYGGGSDNSPFIAVTVYVPNKPRIFFEGGVYEQ